MNKKQLTLQNASLFAELERKAKEMEILEIRLEDAEKKINELNAKNEKLKELNQQAKAENDELLSQIEQLKADLAETKRKAEAVVSICEAVKPEIQEQTDENTECTDTKTITDNSTDNKDFAQEIFEKFYSEDADNAANDTDQPESIVITKEDTVATPPPPAEAVNEEIEEEANNTESIIPPADTLAPPTTKKSDFVINQLLEPEAEKPAPSADLLRDYGARTIGKVTRVTAEVLSKISATNSDASESLKTLALGKNESFKFRIMELAKSKDDPEKVMAEMDLLADEAIVYLRSI